MGGWDCSWRSSILKNLQETSIVPSRTLLFSLEVPGSNLPISLTSPGLSHNPTNIPFYSVNILLKYAGKIHEYSIQISLKKIR